MLGPSCEAIELCILCSTSQWLMLVMQVGPVAVGGLLLFIICDAIDAAVDRNEESKKVGLLRPVNLAPLQLASR